MRLLTIGENERLGWPVSGGPNYRFFWGSVAKVLTAADGIPPYADHAEGECIFSLPAAGGNNYVVAPILSTKKARVRFWSYLAGESVTGNSVLLRVFNGNTKIRFDVSTAREDATRIVFRMRGYNDAGGGAILMPESSPQTYDITNPKWIHHDLEWTAQSDAATADGTMRYTVSDWHEGALRTLKSSFLSGQATGVTPIDKVYVAAYSQNFGEGGGVYYGDLQIDDVFAGETDSPGILLPFIHSPDPERRTCRIKLVCDRPIEESVVTYTGDGMTQTARQLELDENDGGRWVEHELYDLHPGTEYQWSATLTGVDGTSGEITTLDASDPKQCRFIPLPRDDQRVNITTISDVHLQRMAVIDQVLPSHYLTPNGEANVLLWTGDNLSIGYSTDAEDHSVDCIRQWVSFLTEYRKLASRMVSLTLAGGHEYRDFAHAKTKRFAVRFVPQSVISGTSMTRMRYGVVEFFALHLSNAFPAQGLALINGEFAKAIAESTAAHRVCVTHSYGIDAPSTGSPGPESALNAANATALHAVLRAVSRSGSRAYHLHGHAHAGGWWIKDGVVYVTSPCRQLWKPKDYASGEYDYPSDGDPGSVKASVRGYGERGASGFVSASFGRKHSRWQILDSYVSGDPGVYSDKRLLDRTICVPNRPVSAEPRTGAVMVSFLSNLQPGDAIRIVTRNQWNGIRDVRRYQWADIILGGETPAWGHVGLDVFGDWSALAAASLLHNVADRTAVTFGAAQTELIITPKPGWEWGEVAVYNTLTWTPITDRIRVEFL